MGDQLLGRPDVVRGGFGEEVGPVGGFALVMALKESSLDCLAVRKASGV